VALPPLVDNGQRGVGELLGKGARTRNAANIRRNDDEVVGGDHLAGEVVEDDRLNTSEEDTCQTTNLPADEVVKMTSTTHVRIQRQR
jgi:hypothetical protein